MDFKAKIEDEAYDNMRRTFLATGKGRRAALPCVGVITRLLLVQLYYLKAEGERSWTEVQDWLYKLNSDLDPCHHCRLRALIESTFKDYVKQTLETVESFLGSSIDLEFISDFLSTMGINRKTFTDPGEFPKDLFGHLTNQHIVGLHKAGKITQSPKGLLIKWIAHLLDLDISSRLLHFVDKTIKAFEKLSNNKKAKPEALQCFLETYFCLPETSHESSKAPLPNPPLYDEHQYPKLKFCDKCLQLQSENQCLKELIFELQKDKSCLTKEITDLKAKAEMVTEKPEQEISKVFLKFEREHDSVSTLKRDLKSLSEKKSKERSELCERISILQNKIDEGRVKRRGLMNEVNCLKENTVSLNSRLEQKSCFEVNVRGDRNNVFSDDVRKTVIALVCEAGVAAANVKRVIEIVGRNLFNYDFVVKLPCMQSVLNMVDEGYVLSQVQIMESILRSDNITLHSDGTSRDHKKIISHQLSLSNGETLYLGYVPVASENAGSLLDLSLNVLKQLYQSYSDFSFIDTEELMKTVISKITSLMTDRASAMKSYGKLFEGFVKNELGDNVQIHFLHCNAHYLLGFASACEKAVSGVENLFICENHPLGRDKDTKFRHFADVKECATFRLIRTACSILGPNGDQKNGCCMEWVTFCENSLIPF